ncbi:MAG: ROK family protein [Acidimicrobiia bacterium]
METTYGAIEAGGTKFRVATFDGGAHIIEEAQFPTQTPDTTLVECRTFLEDSSIVTLGIGSFGPITLTGSRRGVFGATPKLAWAGASVLAPFESLGIPIALDTDVGAAAVGELHHGAAQDTSDVFYVTVGTGIGGAYATRNGVHHGHGHSEIGHLRVNRIERDEFAGVCPFHGDCFEGMASGTALNARAEQGQQYRSDLVAEYLGQLVLAITYTFAPDRILFGGGVMNVPDMIERIRIGAADALADYSTNPATVGSPSYIAEAGLGQDAGLIGAAQLAIDLDG